MKTCNKSHSEIMACVSRIRTIYPGGQATASNENRHITHTTTNFLPWVETINEYAITRNTDLTREDINELTGLVNKWNKHWPGLGSPGLDQGNGSTSMNGPKLHAEHMSRQQTTNC